MAIASPQELTIPKAWKKKAHEHRVWRKVNQNHIFRMLRERDEARYWARKMKRERDFALRNQEVVQVDDLKEWDKYKILLKVAKAAEKLQSNYYYGLPITFEKAYEEFNMSIFEAKEAGLLGD